MTEDKRLFLGALIRNATTWAVAWGLAGGAVVAAIGLFDPNPGIESLPERVGLAVFSGIAWGVRFGIAGAVIGAAFATAVRIGYRGRSLADLSPVRFALIGAVTGGVGVPLYLQAMNVLSGGPIRWALVADDAVWASVFGAAAAGGSILIARRTQALAPTDRADLLASGDDGFPRPADRASEARAEMRTASDPHA